jgi:hypothetical protein
MAGGVAQQWLQECLQLQTLCRESIHSPSHIPTRLLDIGILEEPTVRLHITTKGQETVEYATLSHKWGAASHATLTKSRLESYLKGISEESLPKTYQHAIKVARNLRLKYL